MTTIRDLTIILTTLPDILMITLTIIATPIAATTVILTAVMTAATTIMIPPQMMGTGAGNDSLDFHRED
jgi:hypothetical protein